MQRTTFTLRAWRNPAGRSSRPVEQSPETRPFSVAASGLVLVAALTLAACSESSPPADACVTQRDCAAGEACIDGQCSTIQVTPCSPGSCGPDAFCDVDGLCKDNATSDAGFREDASADAGTPDSGNGLCEDDDDCGGAPVNVCIAMQCVKGCAEPDGLMCTGGTVCNPATGRCEDNMTCMDDAECGAPQRICEGGQCIAGCGADPSLCVAGEEVCDTNTGRCVALTGPCTEDSDCSPPRTVCESTQCVPGCGEPGGIQCSGAGIVCDETTGRCMLPGGCLRDVDCMNADLVCVDQMCVLRCDRGGMCRPDQVCNPNDGKCLPNDTPLGDPCLIDSQCTSDICLAVNGPMGAMSICARPCGQTSECPLDFTCDPVSQMRFCISETLSSPPRNYDVRSGGFCDDTSRDCQSRFCALGAMQCLEQCSRDADCAGFSAGQCWLFRSTSGNTTVTPLCAAQGGAAAGTSCTTDATCRSAVCYQSSCAALCRRDQDCGATQNCVPYEVQTGSLVHVCAPRGSGAGTGTLGSTCTTNSQCESELCLPVDAAAPGGPRQCSSPCTAHTDCNTFGASARCRPVTGPIANSVVGRCFDR